MKFGTVAKKTKQPVLAGYASSKKPVETPGGLHFGSATNHGFLTIPVM